MSRLGAIFCTCLKATRGCKKSTPFYQFNSLKFDFNKYPWQPSGTTLMSHFTTSFMGGFIPCSLNWRKSFWDHLSSLLKTTASLTSLSLHSFTKNNILASYSLCQKLRTAYRVWMIRAAKWLQIPVKRHILAPPFRAAKSTNPLELVMVQPWECAQTDGQTDGWTLPSTFSPSLRGR